MTAGTFSSPSPGEILKRLPPRPAVSEGRDEARQGRGEPIVIGHDPFRRNALADAMIERGVVLAPLLVTWHYEVMAAKPFVKWLQTKVLLLSKARLEIDKNTQEICYLGTYLEPVRRTATAGLGKTAEHRAEPPAAYQTIWGFSHEGAMHHMFELCRGNIERTSIVETDLRDFVLGLRSFVREAGEQHFEQRISVASTSY